MHLYFTDRDSPITRDVSNWSMDDEIYYDMDMLPEVRVLAAAYTPKPAGARNAAFQKRADELTGGGKRVSIYDIQPQMWTYERTADGRPRAVPRVRLDSRSPLRELQPPELPGDPAARHRLGRQARERRRAPAERGSAATPSATSKAARRTRRRPRRGSKSIPEFDLSLVAAEPLIQKVMNLDWDERGRLWVAETPEYPNGRRVPEPATPGRTAARSQPAQRRAIRRTASRSCPTRTATA